MRRTSLALGVGRDLLLALLVGAAALLVSLTVQLKLTERDMRERSLAGAAQYIDRTLRIDPGGKARLPAPPGSSWSNFGYPTLVFDSDGRLVFERPEGLDPTVVEALSRQRVGGDGQPGQSGKIRFFNLELGEQQIIGAVLRTGSGRNERTIEVFKDVNAARRPDR